MFNVNMVIIGADMNCMYVICTPMMTLESHWEIRVRAPEFRKCAGRWNNWIHSSNNQEIPSLNNKHIYFFVCGMLGVVGADVS